jgi:hypothetical protein
LIAGDKCFLDKIRYCCCCKIDILVKTLVDCFVRPDNIVCGHLRFPFSCWITLFVNDLLNVNVIIPHGMLGVFFGTESINKQTAIFIDKIIVQL